MKQWWKESVVYQIYPKSFADSNGDGIGDIVGITEHLDYLKELGIDVIWLSPVYESPQDDNGYDISDYQKIYKEYGTMEEFDRMLLEAHKRDIKIVMDLVVNHTSDEHKWFKEHPEYYIWKDAKDGKEPNNWGSNFGGPAWSYDEKMDQYYLHCFSPKQPDLNWENEALRNEIYEMMTWWLDKGIDGFRMDVISMISKDQNFPDGELNGLYGDHQPFVCNGPRVHEFLKEMNEKVLSKYDIMTVGEAIGTTIEEAKKYAGEDTNELNMVFQFEHVEEIGEKIIGKWTDKPIPLPELRSCLNKWQLELEGKAWNSLYLDNHDRPRAVSRYGNDSPMYRVVSAKMLATCIHMMKGTPYIYQGEELGMTNAYFDHIEDYKDIETINAYREYIENGLITEEDMMNCIKTIGRDNARTPMQWDKTKHAGFTTGTPWISVNPNYLGINAKDALKEKDSIFYYYKELIALRKKHPIIVHGVFEPLLESRKDIYAYKRVSGDQELIVVCNFTEHETKCGLFEERAGGKRLISNYKTHKKGILKPYEARAVLYEKNI
ncbi:oligo-1,6-glucosidase [Aequitasia blattaphilus]|uniref:Alpha-glucosidase n=1 Tax=Aequitasia blattaphilus TaxID=2949332 RepID=A0ABT1EAY9_9FIRM|nr:alpha-glucosidase [Aequitasia blattaphilus]MCP1102998.1 alpha-glucosidase [Aequitasia blattaphilus]MCR8615638.1 alpha-glucosidase [Aequitasia blattaphilus]